MLPAKICAIHGDNLSFFIFSLPWHLQWTIFFHDFPGWKMKFLNSMTCANPNFNYHSSNTDHVLKTYQLLMAIHCIQKSGKVYIFTVQAHLPTTQTNWQCLFTNLKCNHEQLLHDILDCNVILIPRENVLKNLTPICTRHGFWKAIWVNKAIEGRLWHLAKDSVMHICGWFCKYMYYLWLNNSISFGLGVW